jgi:DNA-binding PadR family transcriptional regulator
MSGYDIKKEVELRLAHFWSESYGHIYPMLRKLRLRGLVGVRAAGQRRGPTRRKLYTITSAGRTALRAWFNEPTPPQRPRNEFLLRLFLGRHAPHDVLMRDLTAYRKRVVGTVHQLRAVQKAAAEASDSPDLLYWEIVLDFGVRIFETLDAWAEAAEQRLGTAKPATKRTAKAAKPVATRKAQPARQRKRPAR